MPCCFNQIVVEGRESPRACGDQACRNLALMFE